MAANSDSYVKRTALFGFLVCCILAVVGAVVANRIRPPERFSNFMGTCPGKVKQLGTSTQIYLADHDEVFPPQDWYRATMPYTKNEGLYTCNALVVRGLKWGYAMNYEFAGRPNPIMKDYSQAILFFETDALGRSVIANLNAIAKPRHGDSVTIGRLDTSIQVLPPDEVLRRYGAHSSSLGKAK